MRNSLNIAKRIAEIASSKKASDIVILDIRKVSSICDYFVIFTGETGRQIEAIRDEVERELLNEGIKAVRIEGDSFSGWILMDFEDVMVHIFTPEERKYYDLENLWSKAEPVLRIL